MCLNIHLSYALSVHTTHLVHRFGLGAKLLHTAVTAAAAAAESVTIAACYLHHGMPPAGTQKTAMLATTGDDRKVRLWQSPQR